jgi:hypothetical protein
MKAVTMAVVAGLLGALLVAGPVAAQEENGGSPSEEAPAVAAPDAELDGTTTTAPEASTTTTARPAEPAEDVNGAPVDAEPPVAEAADPEPTPPIEPEQVEAAAEAVGIDPPSADAMATAEAELSAASTALVVYLVLDVSNPTQQGGFACGDPNHDGRAGTILDCEIEAALAVVAALSSPEVQFALVLAGTSRASGTSSPADHGRATHRCRPTRGPPAPRIETATACPTSSMPCSRSQPTWRRRSRMAMRPRTLRRRWAW